MIWRTGQNAGQRTIPRVRGRHCPWGRVDSNAAEYRSPKQLCGIRLNRDCNKKTTSDNWYLSKAVREGTASIISNSERLRVRRPTPGQQRVCFPPHTGPRNTHVHREEACVPLDSPPSVPVRPRSGEHLPAAATSARLSADEPIPSPPLKLLLLLLPLRAAHLPGTAGGSRSRKTGTAVSRTTAVDRAHHPGTLFPAASVFVAPPPPRYRLRGVLVLRRPVLRVV